MSEGWRADEWQVSSRRVVTFRIKFGQVPKRTNVRYDFLLSWAAMGKDRCAMSESLIKLQDAMWTLFGEALGVDFRSACLSRTYANASVLH